MSIYNRDYKKLTSEEKRIVKEYNTLNSKRDEVIISVAIENNHKKMKLMQDHEFLANHLTLFPNNYFDKSGFNSELNQTLLKEFHEIIDTSGTKERPVLDFIREKKAYFIIASLLDKADFGHHNRAIFKEFPLGTEFAADFLLIGKNSYGYHFIFIELESVTGNVTIAGGDFGEVLRKGINQVGYWKSFLQRDYQSLKSIFNKYKGEYQELPKEFYEYDINKMHYVVIGGRRNDFNETTRRLAEESKRNGIEVIHYDRLFEYAKGLVEKGRL